MGPRKLTPNGPGIVCLFFVFVMLISAFVSLQWLELSTIWTYILSAIIPYSILVIITTYSNVAIQQKWKELQQNLMQNRSGYSSFHTEEDLRRYERSSFFLRMSIIGLHISFGLLVVGLWLPGFVKLSISGTDTLLASYFVASVAAGMLVPYLIFHESW